MKDTPSSLPNSIGRLDQVLTWIALIIGGAGLAIMTLLCAINAAVMRKILNNPIIGAEEMLVVLLVVVVVVSIPFGARTGAHIEIDILESRMSAGFAKWSMLLVKSAGFVLLAIMAWRLWHTGGTAAKFGETSQLLLIPFGPLYYAMAVSIGLYAVVVLLDLWQLFRSGKIEKLKIPGDDL